ncbi:MAG: hypothetical protein Edafosvirus5_66 [Edafosvirus sp.]|uniref:Uncharacterized protein n=1 Tax=Edafosvirus sp. TaxID=2487765 RepID=A0A3G4ZTD4_9VIRU|nr:MAG: hypothetical protein Edafosvirus5_66 [Edafosvirus sp.]
MAVKISPKLCDEEINNYMTSGNPSDLGNCYFYPLTEMKSENTPNPLGLTNQCLLINNKKTSYYIHKYKPERILSRIRGYASEDRTEMLTYINQIFDLTPKDKCCNCISISLYYLDEFYYDIGKLKSYLLCIQRTVKNVRRCLSDWLIRIYLDVSVYTTVRNNAIKEEANVEKRKNVTDILDFLFTAENVEIYTFFCKNILDKSTPIHNIRSYRFLSMIDPSVNISVIREADGIVTKIDCHNIKIFSDSDRIFYFLPFLTDETVRDKSNGLSAYSIWLRLYKKYMSTEYFKIKNNQMEILAGTLAVSLKIKHDKYFTTMTGIKANIDSLFKDQRDDYNYRATSTGFDEIFLLDLFKDLISVPYTIKDDKVINNEKKQYIISQNYSFETQKVDCSNYHLTACIKALAHSDEYIINMEEEELKSLLDEYNTFVKTLDTEPAHAHNSYVLYFIDSLFEPPFVVIKKMISISLNSSPNPIDMSDMANILYPMNSHPRDKVIPYSYLMQIPKVDHIYDLINKYLPEPMTPNNLLSEKILANEKYTCAYNQRKCDRNIIEAMIKVTEEKNAKIAKEEAIKKVNESITGLHGGYYKKYIKYIKKYNNLILNNKQMEYTS